MKKPNQSQTQKTLMKKPKLKKLFKLLAKKSSKSFKILAALIKTILPQLFKIIYQFLATKTWKRFNKNVKFRLKIVSPNITQNFAQKVEPN